MDKIAKNKRPTDINQRAKLIVDIATGKVEENTEENIFVESGRKGGLKGGKARAEKLTAEQRKEIAKKGAQKRWNKD
jgi:hypothetical protein